MKTNYLTIAGLFVTATRNFMRFNKKCNPFHRDALMGHYVKAIKEELTA